MANKTISDLDTAQSLNNNMTIAVEDVYGTTCKVTLGALKNMMEPTGTLQITQNGTYNVKNYASAEVSVQPSTLPTYQITNGILSKPTGTYNLTGTEFSNVTSISSRYALFYAFSNWTLLTGTVDFSSLESIAAYGMHGTFNGCVNLTGTVDFSSLTTLGDSSLAYTFYNCQGITGVDLSGLTSISEPYAMQDTFQGCTNLSSVDLSNLTSVSGEFGLTYTFAAATNLTTVNFTSLTNVSTYAFYYTFRNCTGLTSVNFPSLTTVSGNYAFSNAFYACEGLTDIYFNAINSNTFTYTNAFNNMFSSSTGSTSGGCTVHFPSNMETTIQGLTGYPLFGGTDGYVTLAYDLPATN